MRRARASFYQSLVLNVRVTWKAGDRYILCIRPAREAEEKSEEEEESRVPPNHYEPGRDNQEHLLLAACQSTKHRKSEPHVLLCASRCLVVGSGSICVPSSVSLNVHSLPTSGRRFPSFETRNKAMRSPTDTQHDGYMADGLSSSLLSQLTALEVHGNHPVFVERNIQHYASVRGNTTRCSSQDKKTHQRPPPSNIR